MDEDETFFWDGGGGGGGGGCGGNGNGNGGVVDFDFDFGTTPPAPIIAEANKTDLDVSSSFLLSPFFSVTSFVVLLVEEESGIGTCVDVTEGFVDVAVADAVAVELVVDVTSSDFS